ncbi:NAD(P)/FAD-dependent oxidoreductase [Rhizobium helianthi]|uniref:NAD(P)/FAD-dependent oxidoreductase n=1 Tax=Rhizobium helianthi TaxID=1132695 RepID=A0ABW4M4Z6_9HYPH
MAHPFSEHADNAPAGSGQSASHRQSVDLLVIGAGVMGLWAALKAGRLGLSTLIVDRARPGSGASGGLLGALMPHIPDRWNAKKQFQFYALCDLELEVSRLEAETGLSCGYARCGRLIPLPKPHLRPIAERNGEDAALRWVSETRRFDWTVLDGTPDERWLAAEPSAFGVVYDQLAGRVSPRHLIAALVAACDALACVQRVDGAEVASLMADHVRLADGTDIAFGHCIMASGTGSFPLLEQLGPSLPRRLGRAVKGQAALLRAGIETTNPVLFLNGIYVVPHEEGLVAVGSTSEEEFEQPFETDALLDKVIEKARELSPMLRTAPVVERWAGLRPKAVDRDPMIGPHPEAPRVLALTGGFKVSFGLAHRLADAVLAPFSGAVIDTPDNYWLESHLKVAESG